MHKLGKLMYNVNKSLYSPLQKEKSDETRSSFKN